MGRVDKTVFISYRHTNAFSARAIGQALTHQGYDVFIDFDNIASGDFEGVILENIRARAHFLVLLTPSALERCQETGDLFRREIETALESRRNIVPLMLEGFDFATPKIHDQLTGQLALLKSYNALSIPSDYFAEAIDRLRLKFLNVVLDTVLHPASIAAQSAAEKSQSEAAEAPLVSQEELTAEQWIEEACNAGDPEEKLRCYDEAIDLNPDNAIAFNNRGLVLSKLGEVEAAIEDYSEAIRLMPDFPIALSNRGHELIVRGELNDALEDYNRAIELKASWQAHQERGYVREKVGDVDGALQDYDEALRLQPNAVSYLSRGSARRDKGDLTGALKDMNQAIRLNPLYALAYNSRAVLRKRMGDLRGALEDMDEAIRLHPDNPLYHCNRGIFWKAKTWDPTYLEKAMEDFREAQHIEPGYAVAAQGVGRVSRNMLLGSVLTAIFSRGKGK